MKVTELRIGNYVEVNNYKTIQLENVHNKGCTIGDEQYLISMLRPIPLDDEWLIKFGFEGALLDYSFGKLNVCLKDPRGVYKRGRTYYNNWSILEKQPEYVHELQNLFFVLTGEELIIK